MYNRSCIEAVASAHARAKKAAAAAAAAGEAQGKGHEQEESYFTSLATSTEQVRMSTRARGRCTGPPQLPTLSITYTSQHHTKHH